MKCENGFPRSVELVTPGSCRKSSDPLHFYRMTPQPPELKTHTSLIMITSANRWRQREAGQPLLRGTRVGKASLHPFALSPCPSHASLSLSHTYHSSHITHHTCVIRNSSRDLGLSRALVCWKRPVLLALPPPLAMKRKS